MNNNLIFSDFMKNLPMIYSKKNYWLVRTSSGQNYDAFLNGNYIAIGWNEIPLGALNDIHKNPNNKDFFDQTKELIIVENENEAVKKISQSKALNQVLKFTYDITIGDIVVIPSYNSEDLSFGEVIETPIYQAKGLELMECSFVKRKKVNWIKKNVNRNNLDFDLYKFIFSHQTINKVSNYSDLINATIYDFYVNENNKASLVLRIRKGHDIDPFIMGDLYNDMLYFLKECAEYDGTDLQKNPMSIKFDLQSPGVMLLAGLFGFGLLFLGIAATLSGGDFQIDGNFMGIKLKGKFKPSSLLDKVSDFLDRKQERKLRGAQFLQNMKHFEVAPNEEIRKLAELPPEKFINDPAEEIVD